MLSLEKRFTHSFPSDKLLKQFFSIVSMEGKKEIGNRVESSLKILARSSVVVLAAVIFSKLLSYGYRVIIARYYGPGAYGLLVLALMVIGWFTIFSTLGLHHGLLRYVSLFRGKSQKREISAVMRSISRFLMATGILSMIIVFFLSDFMANAVFNDPSLSIFLKFFAVTIPLSLLSGTYLTLVRSHEEVGWFVLGSKVLDNFVRLLVLGVLVFIGINSDAIFISYLVGSVVILVASYGFCRISFKYVFSDKNELKDKNQLFGEVFSYSWPLMFFGVVQSFMGWTDTLVIGLFQSTEQVGFYNAAWPIALLIAIVPEMFNQLFFPLVTKEHAKGNKETVRQLSKQVVKWIYLLELPIFILVLLFPGVLINLIFGPEYLVASNALRFLVVAVMAGSLSGISRDLISMKGKSKVLLIDIVFISVINIILNVLLVPRYGIDGAAFSTMLSLITLGIVYFLQSHRYLSFVPLRRKMMLLTAIGFISAALLLYVKSFLTMHIVTVFLLGLGFLAVYFLLVLITGCLDKNDMLIIKVSMNKLGKSTGLRRRGILSNNI